MWKGGQDQNIENDTDKIIDGFIKKVKPKPFTAEFISAIDIWRRSFEGQGILIVQLR